MAVHAVLQGVRRLPAKASHRIATDCGLAMTAGGLDAVVLIAAGTAPAPVIATRRAGAVAIQFHGLKAQQGFGWTKLACVVLRRFVSHARC